jgi:hypothetical protein
MNSFDIKYRLQQLDKLHILRICSKMNIKNIKDNTKFQLVNRLLLPFKTYSMYVRTKNPRKPKTKNLPKKQKDESDFLKRVEKLKTPNFPEKISKETIDLTKKIKAFKLKTENTPTQLTPKQQKKFNDKFKKLMQK